MESGRADPTQPARAMAAQTPNRWVDGAFDYVVEPGMVFCVEALISPEGGDFSIRFEDQVLVTETGFENLTTYPHAPALMGQWPI